jgi:hypothetical protein
LKGGYVGGRKADLTFLTLYVWQKDSSCDTYCIGYKHGLCAGTMPVCAGKGCGQQEGCQLEL